MRFLIICILSLLILPCVFGLGEPTQQFNKIYLSPFYLASLTANTNYTYTVNVNPPDGVTSIVNAIITFNGQINGQTQSFNLWVNGKSCNNPTYTIATAFSTTGNLQFYFDCSNVITTAGNYQVKIRSTVNTGTIQGWLDLTYMNHPKGTVSIFGTEYYENDDATLFLKLADSQGVAITNATCFASIYYPNIANQVKPVFVKNAGMMQLNKTGIYYYDFVTPATSGLYIADALCYYNTLHNYYYTLASGKSPIRIATSGTYTGDPFVLNDYSEWLYTQCASGTVGGGNKACDAYYEWSLDSTNVTSITVKYLGESSGAPTMTWYYWNWKTSSWVALPNTLTFHSTASSGVPSGIDEYQSNQITNLTAAINSSSSRKVRIRNYAVAGSTFNLFSNWLTLDVSRVTGIAQELKGSGEIHVSSVIPDSESGRFYKVLTCNGHTDARCAYFNHLRNLPEGEVYDELNISAISTRTGVSINYETPFSVDCTALYNVSRFNGTVWKGMTEGTEYTTYSNTQQQNCIITLKVNIQSGQHYKYKFIYDNYMKWEVLYSKQIFDSLKPSIISYCINRNFTYTTPIEDSTPLSSNTVTDFCHRAYDDYYWLETYYNESLSINTAGEYTSYLQEMRYYRGELYDRYLFLTLNLNTTKIPYKVWTFKPRNLTYYPGINVTVQNNIANAVWTRTPRNLTYYLPTNASIVWSYSKRNLTYYPPTNISGIWSYGARILTYYPPTNISGIWSYNNRQLTYYPATNASAVWKYINRSLTYYTPTNISGIWKYNNRTLTYYLPTNVSGVWSYSTRVLTYYLSNVSGVWSYNNRQLTYYPPTNVSGVWNYNNRQLTYYPPTNISGIWSYNNRVLTYYLPTNATAIWRYVNRSLSYYLPTNVSGVWNYYNRTLTYFSPSMIDGIWSYPSRNLTYYQPTNIAGIWSYPNRNLTYYLPTDVNGIWQYNNRTLTYYLPTNVSGIWSYNNRVLTYYLPTNVSAIWNAANRTLTFYEDKTDYDRLAKDVWNYTVRNLTFYLDTADYNKISKMVWEYNSRNLTFTNDVTNYTKIVKDTWNYNGNVTTNLLSQVASTVWNYVARYIHGEII